MYDYQNQLQTEIQRLKMIPSCITFPQICQQTTYRPQTAKWQGTWLNNCLFSHGTAQNGLARPVWGYQVNRSLFLVWTISLEKKNTDTLLHSPETNDGVGDRCAFAECPRMFSDDGYCCCTFDLSFRRQTIRDTAPDASRKFRLATSN